MGSGRWGLWVLGCALVAAVAAHAAAVEVSEFAAYAQGDVKIRGTVEGDVGSSSGDVRLQGDTLIDGDVLAAGQVSASRSVVVKGTITPLMQPVLGTAASDPGLPTLPNSFLPSLSSSQGGASYKGKYTELDLDPGSYGSLKVQGTKQGGSLFLSSGEYYFDQLTAKKMDFKFDVSKGAVTIYVGGKMSLGSGVNVFVASPDGSFLSLEEAGSELAGLVYAQADSLVKISGSEWAGTLYTPDGKLLVKKSTIDGALYSRNSIQITGSALAYTPLDLTSPTVWPSTDGEEPPPGTIEPGDVALSPEPATITLLLAGASSLLVKVALDRKAKARRHAT